VVLYPWRSIFTYVKYLNISEKKIHHLEQELQKIRLQNAELRKHIPVDSVDPSTTPYELLKAHIIGRDPTNINGYLYIDKGITNGVIVDQPVLTTNGLVGKILYVGEQYSVVETIEHEGFAISALDLHTGVHGIVRKNTHLLFDFIRADDFVAINDSIYTSGMSEIFPEGILIGRITHIAVPDDPFFKPVYLTPSVRVNRLVYLYVLLGVRTGSIDMSIPSTGASP
jgi:rod shape-determining protein MreC